MYKELVKNVGRLRIKTSIEPTGDAELDRSLIESMLTQCEAQHNKNVRDMKILKKYYDNCGTFDKDKKTRSDIDNYVEVPESFRISKDLNGHICGDGVIFSDYKGNKIQEIMSLNEFINDSNFGSSYLKANNFASIYGVGYYYVEPNNDNEELYTPFVIESENLNPMNTFCVYNYDVIPKKIWAVNISEYKDLNGKLVRRYNVWSKYAQYTLEKNGSNYSDIEYYALAFSQIPIIEIERNVDRVGDSELVLSLIAAKNLLFSNRVDDVQQVVDYVYLLYNLELPREDEDGNEIPKKQALKKILDSRVIELSVQNPQIPPNVSILKNPLNQSEIQTLASYIDSVINQVVGLPDRSSSSSNNDTGLANDYKLGFRSLESYSDSVTTFIIKSLKDLLRVCLSIARNSDYASLIKELKVKDVEIKPQRNKVFSMTDSANAYATLRASGFNDEDSIKFTGVSQDIAESHKKNVEERDEKRAYEQSSTTQTTEV